MLRLFLISVALYIVIICGGYIFLYLHGYIGPDFFERTPPEIEVIQEPKGIGLLPTRLQFLVRDSGAGLDEVVVRAQQAKRKLDIFSQYYHEKNKEDRISIDISGKEQGLREGSVAFSILAFDKGFFNNKASKILELPVDYRKPRLEVLSPQHNVNQGGVEFAFYKLADGTAVKSGIKTGDLVFRGYPAKLLDPGFESMPEVYFSFFAVPTAFRVGEEKILAFATNAVANTSLAEFYYHIIPRRFRSEEVNLKEYFVRTKLEELLDHLGGNPEDVPMNIEE
ncbi:MAG: hypothetical protein GYA55_12200, partial [SAR324 cluster bacterium]|nr:hypothetical protein [SAR324 cluster bacterium]